MGRAITPLGKAAIEPALGDLQRAAIRKADIFARPEANNAASLADAAKRIANAAGATAQADILNLWVSRNLTDTGRVKMLASMRRTRADSVSGKLTSKTIRLSAGTFNNLKLLTTKTGMPMATTLNAAIEVALVNEELRRQMAMFTVATGSSPKAKLKARRVKK